MSAKERVVIFGGAGFIGSHLTEELEAAGWPVRVFDKTRGDWRNLAAVQDRVELVEGDFLNAVDVRGALAGCGAAVHLVSATLPSSSNENPVYDVEANVVSTLRFLEAAREARVPRLIFISSGGTVYGPARATPIDEEHPTDPACSYGIGKLAIEKYLGLWRRLYGLEDTVLRFSNPYGERQNPAAAQGAVAVFLGRALRGEPIDIWGDGSVVRDYLYIGDGVRAIRQVLENRPAERVFNVGSGVPTSLNALVEALRRVTGRSIEVRYQAPRPVDVPVNVLDSRRLLAAVGWRADTSLEDGLARTWRWLEARARHDADAPTGTP